MWICVKKNNLSLFLHAHPSSITAAWNAAILPLIAARDTAVLQTKSVLITYVLLVHLAKVNAAVCAVLMDSVLMVFVPVALQERLFALGYAVNQQKIAIKIDVIQKMPTAMELIVNQVKPAVVVHVAN